MVTDFGVAKALSASSNTERGSVTSLGVAIGTPAYSPEQASADPAVDHRADIYAFGVLAYELLSGQPPFIGRTPQNLRAAHVTESPEAIGKRRASLPPALAALVMRCLEKRPADRPQSARAVVHALAPSRDPVVAADGTHLLFSITTSKGTTLTLRALNRPEFRTVAESGANGGFKTLAVRCDEPPRQVVSNSRSAGLMRPVDPPQRPRRSLKGTCPLEYSGSRGSPAGSLGREALSYSPYRRRSCRICSSSARSGAQYLRSASLPRICSCANAISSAS